MIKINLLPQKRAKLRATASSDGGQKEMAIGIASLVGAAAVVFVAFDMPRRSKLSDLHDAIDQANQDLAGKRKQLDGYDTLKKAADAMKERAHSINRLVAAKVVPANVLQELGDILTVKGPTMTDEMIRRTGNGPDSDPNRKYDQTWDPTHVWLTTFSDKEGAFKLEGGAQAEVDITQLSKRMQASVYFNDVSPSQEERVSDRDTGIAYYKFTITGKVAY